jgi:hypothetical protein
MKHLEIPDLFYHNEIPKSPPRMPRMEMVSRGYRVSSNQKKILKSAHTVKIFSFSTSKGP